MTDKVQKIREEVEGLKSQLLRGACSSQITMETHCKEEAYNEVLAILDTMKEEPKTDWLQELQERLDSLSKEDFEKVLVKYKLREEGSVDYDKLNAMLDESLSKETKESLNESLGITQEEYGKIVDECIYGKEPELVDVDDLPNKEEEPVSDDLEKEVESYIAINGYDGLDTSTEVFDIAHHFANWQKQQFEKDYTNLCNGIATAKGFSVAMAYDKGMADAKEQQMANAIDVTVHVEAGNYPYIPQIELYDYDKDVPLAKEGDKYKVILIKED